MSDKVIFRLVWGVSIFVFLVVALLQTGIITWKVVPGWVIQLPKVNAMINGTCTVLLITSFFYIRKGNVEIHKRLNILTFMLSALFLVLYIIYHSSGNEAKFGGDGVLRPIYFFILITHIILSAIVLPLVLLSFYRGMKMQVEKHRKLVRWSFPIWLYVTITGVLVYLMMAPYY
ncbi:DUF420 domain-containing protein [Olivibacter sp. SDN3]|uniref:DUF420 domain-containing protein n=1 Tax=Olivibacter sp. SDN3 TaxID=2764720 RepID=UPI001651A842|nr:DUF420 domain-containing protein [Olivibacter sp. SDN3]QNL51357.1 DUF420 domain-containing protein [Olivibacter sp. SDN3]